MPGQGDVCNVAGRQRGKLPAILHESSPTGSLYVLLTTHKKHTQARVSA